MKQRNNIIRLIVLLVLAGAFTSCGRDNNNPGNQFSPEMYESIPYEAFKQVMDSTAPFRDGQILQVPPEGTISREGHAAFAFPPGDDAKKSAEVMALKNPISLSPEVLEEGKLLYLRFCGICHGKSGKGDGKVAGHDAINPVSYQADRLKAFTAGQIYHTIMYGQGMMGSYASQLDHDQRWKVVHFVQTLQGNDPIIAEDTASDSTSSDATGTENGHDQ